MKYVCLLALLVVLTVTSCNKKPTATSTTESILKGGKWHLSSGTLTVPLPDGKDTALNYVSLIVPICHQNDYIQFYSGVSGAVYAGGTKCSPSDPDSVSFNWELINNNSAINIYNSQAVYYSVIESILPYVYDTISKSPLVLDSVSYNGGSKVPGGLTIARKIYDLTFKEIAASPTPPSTSLVDIDGATITNLSSTSFTINFSIPGTWPDSMGGHEASPGYLKGIYSYSLTYTNL